MDEEGAALPSQLFVYLGQVNKYIKSADTSYYLPAVKSHNPTGIWNSIAHTAANIINMITVFLCTYCSNAFLYELEEKVERVVCDHSESGETPKPFVGIQQLQTGCKHWDRWP